VSIQQEREEALASHVAQGGRTREFNQERYDAKGWLNEVPGLSHEIELVAWGARSQERLKFVFGACIRKVPLVPDAALIELIGGGNEFPPSTRQLADVRSQCRGSNAEDH